MSITNSRKPWHASKACALVGILYRRKKTIISIVCYKYIVQIRMFCFAQRFILTDWNMMWIFRNVALIKSNWEQD